jgi:LysR family transcriptional regulator, glycine cleavage system transcriptional activator
VDVVVRFGIGVPRGGEVLASAPDTVYPVAAPAFRDRLPATFDYADLNSFPLLASDMPDPLWISWPEWFENATGASVPVKPALRFTNYTDCVQAAIVGQGIALGWDFLLRRLLDNGQLVRIVDHTIVPEGRYQVVATTRRQRSETVSSFVEWCRQAFDPQRERDR